MEPVGCFEICGLLPVVFGCLVFGWFDKCWFLHVFYQFLGLCQLPTGVFLVVSKKNSGFGVDPFLSREIRISCCGFVCGLGFLGFKGLVIRSGGREMVVSLRYLYWKTTYLACLASCRDWV